MRQERIWLKQLKYSNQDWSKLEDSWPSDSLKKSLYTVKGMFYLDLLHI